MAEDTFTIVDLINGVTRLPAAPRVLPKLQGLLRDPNSTLDDITKLLKLDAGLAAQILRLSNSAYYGVKTKFSVLDLAINRIGFNEVFKLVGAIATRDLLSGELSFYNMNKSQLWRLSVACANYMSILSVSVLIQLTR